MIRIFARLAWTVLCCSSAACGGTNAAADGAPANSMPAAIAPPVPPTVPAGLLEAREAVWRAYFTCDSVGLVALLPEQMIGMGETRAQIIANAQAFVRGSWRYEGITFTDDEFIVSDSMVVTFANYDVKVTENGKPVPMKGHAIEVFKLVDGHWINPSWHLHDK